MTWSQFTTVGVYTLNIQNSYWTFRFLLLDGHTCNRHLGINLSGVLSEIPAQHTFKMKQLEAPQVPSNCSRFEEVVSIECEYFTQDGARRKMHERLETETIHASILRHKLQFLPAQIREEIKAAVLSARQSNASAQNEMQEKLEQIQKSMSDLEEHQHDLDKENAKLQ